MAVTDIENILKVLNHYNKWWETKAVPSEFLREYKRPIYFTAQKAFRHPDIRRHVILSGARRTGKTTIVYQTIDALIKNGVAPKKLFFVSFDHPTLKLCSIEEILDVYRKYVLDDDNIYLFLDEIQYAENWSQWLKIIYDTSPRIKVMATGSASSAIESKTEESGLGRFTVVPVPTLSFYEYLELSGGGVLMADFEDVDPLKLHELPLQRQTAIFSMLDKLQAAFLKYVQVGGFPEISMSNDPVFATHSLRSDVIDKAIKQDIPAAHELRNTKDLERVFVYLCYHSASQINIEAMCKELTGISRITISKYISYLESAKLIYVSSAVNLSGKSMLKLQDKIYVADSSIRNCILLSGDVLTNPAEMGVLVEGIIYRHIKYYFLNTFAKVGFFRTDAKGREIDIVAHRDGKPLFLAEAKYRESAEIKESDAIVTTQSGGCLNYVVTKRSLDFGLKKYPGGNAVFRVPAHALLYLLGWVESKRA